MYVERSRKIALVALVAGLAIGIALVVALLGSVGTYRVSAVFDQTYGLIEGGEVKAGGVIVGEIERIELGEDGYPRVDMAIEREFPLRRGATANARVYSLAGQLNRYVDLFQGDGPPLDDGATLGLARTDQSVEFDELLATLSPETRDDVGTVLDRVDRATRGRGPELERTLARSAEALAETTALVNEVGADGAALRTLVEDGRRVVGALAEDPAELQALADRLAPVLETTARRESELTRSLELLPGSLRSGRLALADLDATIPDLRRVVRVAKPAVRELVPTVRELRPTLAEARPTLREVRELSQTAPADLTAARPLLRKLPPVARTLDSVLAQLNPALDHIRVRGPELTGFTQLTADATANYDFVGQGARVAAIFKEPPQRLIGPSDDRFGCLVRPFERTPGVLEGAPWDDYDESFVGGGRHAEAFITPDERRAPGGGNC